MSEPSRNDSIDQKTNTLPSFSPGDPLDGRKPGSWRSIYTDREPRRAILVEAIYLVTLLYMSPLLMTILWLGGLKEPLGISDTQNATLTKFGMAWLGGMLGGTLFDLKWLYHSVAKKVWHLDRQLWRFLTPHISGGFAFTTVALVSSGLIRVFDPQVVESLTLVVGIAFLVGHFSDSAIAKLAEVAETLFGASRGKEKHREKPLPCENETTATRSLPPTDSASDSTKGNM